MPLEANVNKKSSLTDAKWSSFIKYLNYENNRA